MTDVQHPALPRIELPLEGSGSDPSHDQPRRLRSLSRADLLEMALAAASGVCGSLLLCTVMDWRDPLTFVLWTLLAYLAVGWLLARDRLGAIAATDQVVRAAVWATAIIAIALLLWLITYLVIKGIPGLNAAFLTQDLSKSGPLDPNGGALHSIIGTLQQTAIATVVAVPLGILTAIYLHELNGKLSPAVRFVSDAMSGLPSIVAGLLIYTVWVSNHGFSGIAGSAALVVIMLPVITRTSEEILRTINPGLRESALALGSPEWRTVLRVVLPTARAGLVTASILGVARVVGETAPLILTALGSASTNTNPLSGAQSALPLFVFQLLKQPNDVQIQRAWTGALVLVAIVLVLFVLARVVGARSTKRLGGQR